MSEHMKYAIELYKLQYDSLHKIFLRRNFFRVFWWGIILSGCALIQHLVRVDLFLKHKVDISILIIFCFYLWFGYAVMLERWVEESIKIKLEMLREMENYFTCFIPYSFHLISKESSMCFVSKAKGSQEHIDYIYLKKENVFYTVGFLFFCFFLFIFGAVQYYTAVRELEDSSWFYDNFLLIFLFLSGAFLLFQSEKKMSYFTPFNRTLLAAIHVLLLFFVYFIKIRLLK